MKCLILLKQRLLEELVENNLQQQSSEVVSLAETLLINLTSNNQAANNDLNNIIVNRINLCLQTQASNMSSVSIPQICIFILVAAKRILFNLYLHYKKTRLLRVDWSLNWLLFEQMEKAKSAHTAACKFSLIDKIHTSKFWNFR